MHWAAKRGDLDVVQLLHDNGAPLNEPAKQDPCMVPLHWAAAEGKVEIVEFFLNQGIDINVQDGNRCSPAIVAVQYRQMHSFLYLWKHGADITLVDVNGDHCLHWAVYKGYDEFVHLVLHILPAELNRRDNFGQVSQFMITQNCSLLRDVL